MAVMLAGCRLIVPRDIDVPASWREDGGCDDDCQDRAHAHAHGSKELGELAMWHARRGNCVCGFALADACRDAVRVAVYHSAALQDCMGVAPSLRRIRIAELQA